MTATVLRYWHTLRHLKPVQITARARHALLKPRLPVAAMRSDPPRLRFPVAPFAAPIARAPSMTGPETFVFLGEAGSVGTATDWNAADRAKLWLYNLHYFDDLNAEGAAGRVAWHREFITRWMRDNPPGFGNGWEPYCLSLRIVNWVKWALAGNDLGREALASLALQADALGRRIEWHLLGNHLLANAKALVFAGAFFEGAIAERMRARGLDILRAELDEQVLADGGHFERSPMYHALLLEDVLDLVNLDRAYGVLGPDVRARLIAVADRLRGWLRVMTHPDGEIALFNDAAFGIAGTPAALEAYAARLGLDVKAGTDGPPLDDLTHLAASGYLRLAKPGVTAILDCAPIGPDYLPGHAHADTLSFELSLGGERVVVNGGTSVYGTGPDRQRQRGTAAHSTVEIDAENSSEVWGGFRVARRARVLAVEATSGGPDRPHVVRASHDGYRRLPGRNVHTRTWSIDASRLTVQDDVTGRYRTARARFHMMPGTTLAPDADGGTGLITTVGGRPIRWHSTPPATVEASRWHPRFGASLDTHALVVPVVDGRSRVTLEW